MIIYLRHTIAYFLLLQGSTVNMNVMGPMYEFLNEKISSSKKQSFVLGWTLMVGELNYNYVYTLNNSTK